MSGLHYHLNCGGDTFRQNKKKSLLTTPLVPLLQKGIQTLNYHSIRKPLLIHIALNHIRIVEELAESWKENVKIFKKSLRQPMMGLGKSSPNVKP